MVSYSQNRTSSEDELLDDPYTAYIPAMEDRFTKLGCGVLVEAINSLASVLIREYEMITRVYDHPHAFSVYLRHQRYLGAAFLEVVLIDTNRVNPDNSSAHLRAEVLQQGLVIPSKEQKVPEITEICWSAGLGITIFPAPCVRNGLVLRETIESIIHQTSVDRTV